MSEKVLFKLKFAIEIFIRVLVIYQIVDGQIWAGD